MPTLLQINVTANWGSTGKIAEDIGKLAIEAGWESWIAYGRGNPTSASRLIRIGNDFDMKSHALQSRLFDNHGLASKKVTEVFVRKIKEIKPDIIHLHNIHGYYINYPILFDFLKKYGKPVVWTLHDCWPFTGHCAYYSFAKCNLWQTGCHNCPQLKNYPSSLFIDRSKKNYLDKKNTFLGCENLTIVTVSNWLKRELSESFLKEYPSQTIYNGIDVSIFHQLHTISNDSSKKIILGVASVWDKRKGLDDFISLRKKLPDDYIIMLVGLSNDQISTLPEGITGIRRTENVEQLVALYNMATVFVNPSIEETMGMTTVEAMACGTPAIVYNSTASPEIVNKDLCKIVTSGNIDGIVNNIKWISENFTTDNSNELAKWVEMNYEKREKFKEYINLYNSLLKQ
ncbi:glycosyltransferase [uncultured Duncaniella sp.]|uniref:glycosyltransferase n=1 Tax=uncultured Duncaniella sp. TaxID=2768039 RepID=UPI0025A9E80A|nr:glycosyltransferase [uncultured Duncaniella sp.]